MRVDVLRHGRAHKSRQRFARAHSAADLGGADRGQRGASMVGFMADALHDDRWRQGLHSREVVPVAGAR